MRALVPRQILFAINGFICGNLASAIGTLRGGENRSAPAYSVMTEHSDTSIWFHVNYSQKPGVRSLGM